MFSDFGFHQLRIVFIGKGIQPINKILLHSRSSLEIFLENGHEKYLCMCCSEISTTQLLVSSQFHQNGET